MKEKAKENENLTRREFVGRSARVAAGVSTVAVLGSGTVAAVATNDRIKIGQIGVGHAHASGKMRSYRKSDAYEVVGVVEPDLELRRRAEGSGVYRDVKWMTQEQLLNVPELKAVAVETRVRDLLNVAEVCVKAGKHIHLDKPAGSSLPQFQRILKAADRQGLTVQMGYMYRYNPAVLLLKEALREGWLGEIFEVHTVMSKVVNRASRKRLGEYPGGMMFELGCHIIDLVIGVLGRPQQVTPYKQHAASIDDNLADNMLAVLTYPRALATVKSSAMEVEGFKRRHFAACGNHGTLHIQPLDAPDVRLALDRSRGKYKRGYQDVPFGDYERYIGDAADLAKIIRGEKESDYKSDHDFAVQETILKASGLPVG